VNIRNRALSHLGLATCRSGHELFTTRRGLGHTLTAVHAADPTSAMSLGTERSDVAAPVPGESTPQLSVAGTSDHCVNCGAPLASDQRYCVVCGERRGKPRFALAGPHEEPVQEVVTTKSASTPRRPRTSAGFNLIAGIATLLLAMGVGVLIGHNSSSNNSGNKAAATPAITVNAAGAGSGAAASRPASTGSGSGNSTASTGKSKKSASTKSAKSAQTKVVVQKAAAAASKVTGGSAKTAGATAQQGSACSAGTAGCQNGKLTGNYFGQ